ncbi:MAG: TetR/AcrR family transcriptional regulator [Proteobacteria bacterium]|nr:TetR/AcrR family transcriptional regulator [Pseudomonadota bacterium]HQR04555.1 helix-turn-helix domain-containing protein [Rhodocyclaceae bacterium]
MSQPARIATRESLPLTAERLFAQDGVEGVSLRAIALAAGQRNVSALHYHFGGKEPLIGALLAMRLQPINARRKELLASLDRENRGEDLRGLVEALTLPMLEQLQDPDNHWVGLLHQLYLHTQDGLIFAGIDAALVTGMDHIFTRIARVLAPLPTALRESRMRLAGAQQVYSAADWYYRRAAGQQVIPLEQLAANLVDFIVGGLMAPVSPGRIRLGKPALRTAQAL